MKRSNAEQHTAFASIFDEDGGEAGKENDGGSGAEEGNGDGGEVEKPVEGSENATSSPSYMTPGTATTTSAIYDAYVSTTAGGLTYKADSVGLLEHFCASSSAAVLTPAVEYSNDGIDWFRNFVIDPSQMGTTSVANAYSRQDNVAIRVIHNRHIDAAKRELQHCSLVDPDSDARLETKRKQAENEINSAIAAKYMLPLEEVPALLGQICELLAVGYIDYEEFGKDGEGVKWLGEGRALLKAIQKGTQPLIGADGTELERNANVAVLNGYPND
jgi:phage gp36-like protein